MIAQFTHAEAILVLLKDANAMKEVKQDMTSIFNMDAADAEKGIEKLAQSGYNNHPVVFLLRSLNTYWALYPIKQKPKAKEIYLRNLELCYEAANKMLKVNDKEPEALFFAAISQLMQASVHGELGNSMAAINHSRIAYGWVKEIKAYKTKNAELSLILGLYDYFRVWYPETHHGYKPLMALFMEGNKAEGLAELEFAAQKGIFTSANARIFLTTLNLNFEKQVNKSALYISSLVKEFPNNWYFQNIACEVFIRAGKYEEASEMLESVKKGDCPYKSLIIAQTAASLEEFRDKDIVKAIVLYKKATELLSKSTGIPNNVKAGIYAGQARMSAALGRKAEAINLYKTVKKLGTNNYLAEEADKYLGSN